MIAILITTSALSLYKKQKEHLINRMINLMQMQKKISAHGMLHQTIHVVNIFETPEKKHSVLYNTTISCSI